jgi:large subunit ribosomal protein L21
MADKNSAKLAVIRTGGKQFLVTEGEYLEVEKLDLEEGAKFVIDDILLVIEGDKVTIGQPVVAGASADVTVLAQVKDDKKIIFKYKAKKNYRVKTGHRQKLTKIQIDKITLK